MGMNRERIAQIDAAVERLLQAGAAGQVTRARLAAELGMTPHGLVCGLRIYMLAPPGRRRFQVRDVQGGAQVQIRRVAGRDTPV